MILRKHKNEIIEIVEKVQEKKATNPSANIESIESQIDAIGYSIYVLSKEEIKEIEE